MSKKFQTIIILTMLLFLSIGFFALIHSPIIIAGGYEDCLYECDDWLYHCWMATQNMDYCLPEWEKCRDACWIWME
jgi:hypothetical protein